MLINFLHWLLVKPETPDSSLCNALQTLGLECNPRLPCAEIKWAYRILARKHHPDHAGPSKEEQMKAEMEMQKLNAADGIARRELCTRNDEL